MSDDADDSEADDEGAPTAADAVVREPETDVDRRASSLARYGIPVATVACAVVAGFREGAPLAVLVLAGGVLVSVIAIFWTSIRTLLGETPLTGADAYAIAAPRAEEEQKRAVLRALKDLEFERSVGKISEDDYRELVAYYRAEAKRLLRALDESAVTRHGDAEELVAAKLRAEGLVEGWELDEAAAKPVRTSVLDDETEPKKKGRSKRAKRKRDAAAKSPAPEPAVAEPDADSEAENDAPAKLDGRACAECGTRNDTDAVFCKKCGARQASEESA